MDGDGDAVFGADFGGGVLHGGFGTGGEVEMAALGGEDVRGGEADTFGGAGNEDGFAGEVKVHSVSS